MNAWVIRILVAGAAFALCWLGAIAYWRETNRMPGADDLVLYLLLLPLLLLLALWAGRKLLARIKGGAAAGAAAAAAAAAAGAAAAGATPTDASPPPPPPLTVLAGALRMPHGDSAARLAAALLTRKANLALDPELTNDAGYPILSGRVDDVDPLAQQDSMRDWLRTHHPQAAFSAEQWRALALGTTLAADLALELGLHPALPAYLDALDARKPLPPLPVLVLAPLLPPEWQHSERAAVADWLRQAVALYWPQAHVVVPAVAPGQAPLDVLEQLAAQARREEQPFLCLLLACGSHIGADSVETWTRQVMLFDSEHPHGRVPGEGAAGLLLADAAQGALFGRDDVALLHAAGSARRSASSDDKPRLDAGLLPQLAAQALAVAGAGGLDVALVTADSDQRASRMNELMTSTSAALPELDLASQVLAVGSACGDAGAVSTVAALVLARQQVGAGLGPALCISNLDPFHRSAVLLTPQVAALATA